MIRSISLAAVAVLALGTAACGSDSIITPIAGPPRGIVVLDGFIQPGLTLLADTGTSTQRIAFAPSTEFDGGAFRLENDTAVAASSRGAGDLLYVADLRTASVRRLQMPAGSNPSTPRVLRGSGGRALIGVPLRDSASVALVTVDAGGSATFEFIRDLGTCPSDVFRYGDATWVVDANAACATNYRPQGAMRLIRIPDGGGERTVLPLPLLRGSSAGVILQGDVAWISAGGDVDFSTSPFTLLATGGIVRVDLRNRTILSSRSMPNSTYGGSARLGADGELYITIFEDIVDFQSRVIMLGRDDLQPRGPRNDGREWLTLRNAAGEAPSCTAATADGLGRIHCIQNRTGSATFLMVFGPDGNLVREVAAGQGGVDLHLR